MNLSLQNQWVEIQSKLEKIWDEKFAPRYDALGESEQRTVKAAAIVLPIIIFIFGIVLPVLDQNNALKQDINTLSTQVSEANHLSNLLAANPQKQQKENTDNNILSHVDKLARQSGVRSFMTRLRPQQIMGKAQRLQTQIKNVPYQKVTAFLTLLEENGYQIDQLKIQSAGIGLVHAQATIGK